MTYQPVISRTLSPYHRKTEIESHHKTVYNSEVLEKIGAKKGDRQLTYTLAIIIVKKKKIVFFR